MEPLIIDAACTVKNQKKKPTLDAIYNTFKKDYEHDINFEEFCRHFLILVSRGTLVNIKPMDDIGSYHVCNEKSRIDTIDDNISRKDDFNDAYDCDLPDDNNLIGMIKNVMMEEKLNDKSHITELKQDIVFLKQELIFKNNIINSLLEMVKVNNMSDNTKIETIPITSTNVNNTSINKSLNFDDSNLNDHNNNDSKSIVANSRNNTTCSERNVNDGRSVNNSIVENTRDTELMNSSVNSEKTFDTIDSYLIDETFNDANNKLQLQLNNLRKDCHEVFLRNRVASVNHTNNGYVHATNNTEKHSINNNEKWPNNTVLIVGDYYSGTY